jgi:hypothetical protein
MSEEVKDVEVTSEETKEKEPMKFGTTSSLIINMVRENRVYRFEMPHGAKLDECEEACIECVNVVKKIKEQSEKQQEEAKKKAESESADEDSKKEE